MKFDFDEMVLSEALHSLADAVVVHEVKEMKKALEHDLESRPCYGVFHNGKKKDIKEIKKHIKAAKLVLGWFEVQE